MERPELLRRGYYNEAGQCCARIFAACIALRSSSISTDSIDFVSMRWMYSESKPKSCQYHEVLFAITSTLTKIESMAAAMLPGERGCMAWAV